MNDNAKIDYTFRRDFEWTGRVERKFGDSSRKMAVQRVNRRNIWYFASLFVKRPK